MVESMPKCQKNNPPLTPTIFSFLFFGILAIMKRIKRKKSKIKSHNCFFKIVLKNNF